MSFPLPSHCECCGVLLQGGATVHAEDCPFYPGSYHAIMLAIQKARICLHCGEPVLDGEQSLYFQHQPMHVECGTRVTMGSVAHIERRCGCYLPGSVEGDPEGMTAREAARAAMRAWAVMERRKKMAGRN